MCYLERAKAWIEGLDGVDIETVESTIERFSYELAREDSQSEKFRELSETIKYLKEQLIELGLEANLISEAETTRSVEITFDPSSLASDKEVVAIKLTHEERKNALSELSQHPTIVALKRNLNAKLLIGEKG